MKIAWRKKEIDREKEKTSKEGKNSEKKEELYT